MNHRGGRNRDRRGRGGRRKSNKEEHGIPAVTFRRRKKHEVRSALKRAVPNIEDNAEILTLLVNTFFNNQTETFQVSKIQPKTWLRLGEIESELLLEMMNRFNEKSPAKRSQRSRNERFQSLVTKTWRRNLILSSMRSRHTAENADTEIKGSLCFDPQNQQAGVGRVRKVRPGSRVIVEWPDGVSDEFRKEKLEFLHFSASTKKACDTAFSKGSPIAFDPSIEHYSLIASLDPHRVWDVLIYFCNILFDEIEISLVEELLKSLLQTAKDQQFARDLQLQQQHVISSENCSDPNPKPSRPADNLCGSVVLAPYKGEWFPARVSTVYDDDSVKATFLGWIDAHIIQPDDIKKLDPPKEPEFFVGQEVMGEYNGEWYKATIVKSIDEYTYSISYPEFPDDEPMEACYTQIKTKAQYREKNNLPSRRERETPSRSRKRMSSSESPRVESPPKIKKRGKYGKYGYREASDFYERQQSRQQSSTTTSEYCEQDYLPHHFGDPTKIKAKAQPPSISPPIQQPVEQIQQPVPPTQNYQNPVQQNAPQPVAGNYSSLQQSVQSQIFHQPVQSTDVNTVQNQASLTAENAAMKERLAKLEAMVMTQQAAAFPFMNPSANFNNVSMMPTAPWPQPSFQDPFQNQFHMFPQAQVQQSPQTVPQTAPLSPIIPMMQMQPIVTAGGSNPPAQNPVQNNADSVDWTKTVPMDYNSKPLPKLPNSDRSQPTAMQSHSQDPRANEPKRLGSGNRRGRGKPRSRRG